MLLSRDLWARRSSPLCFSCLRGVSEGPRNPSQPPLQAADSPLASVRSAESCPFIPRSMWLSGEAPLSHAAGGPSSPRKRPWGTAVPGKRLSRTGTPSPRQPDKGGSRSVSQAGPRGLKRRFPLGPGFKYPRAPGRMGQEPQSPRGSDGPARRERPAARRSSFLLQMLSCPRSLRGERGSRRSWLRSSSGRPREGERRQGRPGCARRPRALRSHCSRRRVSSSSLPGPGQGRQGGRGGRRGATVPASDALGPLSGFGAGSSAFPSGLSALPLARRSQAAAGCGRGERSLSGARPEGASSPAGGRAWLGAALVQAAAPSRFFLGLRFAPLLVQAESGLRCWPSPPPAGLVGATLRPSFRSPGRGVGGLPAPNLCPRPEHRARGSFARGAGPLCPSASEGRGLLGTQAGPSSLDHERC